MEQLLAGWFGGLAVGLMAFTKPVKSYVREDDLRFVDSEMRAQLPITQAEPMTI